MTYFEGFIVPVPAGNKDAYTKHGSGLAPLLREVGVKRQVEAWESDVPEGKLTDFKGAVKAEDWETIVFSWIEWPSKESRDEGWKQVMADPGLQPDPAAMPFDGKRMIYGGFKVIVEA